MKLSADRELIEGSSGDLESMKAALRAGANPNAMDEYGDNPLGIAAGAGFEDGVRILLEHGADIGVLDGNGYAPLMHAARNGRAGCVRLLLAAGADAAALGERGARGATALVFAAQAGCKECLSALLEGGADAKLANAWGQTALMLAVNDPECMEILLPHSDARAADRDGWDPLMWAVCAMKKRRECINVVLPASDLLHRSAEGKSAADYARDLDSYGEESIGDWLTKLADVERERRALGAAAQTAPANAGPGARKRKL